MLAAITALEKIDSESGNTIYLGLWDYWLRVARLKDVPVQRDVMESSLGMDSATEEPLDAVKLKVVDRRVSDPLRNCPSKSSVKASE